LRRAALSTVVAAGVFAAAAQVASADTVHCPSSSSKIFSSTLAPPNCFAFATGTSGETNAEVAAVQNSGTLSIIDDAPFAINCSVPLSDDGDTYHFRGNSPLRQLTFTERFEFADGTGNFCYASFAPFIVKPGTAIKAQVVDNQFQWVGALPDCVPNEIILPCIFSSSASAITVVTGLDPHGRG
jgi:hypothetical protein